MKTAVLELTSRCNLNCTFCYCACHDHPEAFGKGIHLEAWKDLVEQCFRSGISSFTLTGGEPTLYDGVEQLVRMLLEHPVVKECECYTNLKEVPCWLRGVVAGKEKMRVTTSLQGVYGRASALGCSFPLEVWKHHCREVVDLGIPLRIAITVTKQNMGDLEYMIDMAAKMQASKIFVNTMVMEGRGLLHPELWLSAEEIQDVYRRARMMRSSLSQVICLPEEYYCSCRTDGVIPEGLEELGCKEKCEVEKEMIVFGPDGRMRKCMHVW